MRADPPSGGLTMFGLPPKADMCSALANVGYRPIADIVSDTAQQKTPELSPEGFPRPQINLLGSLLPLPAPREQRNRA